MRQLRSLHLDKHRQSLVSPPIITLSSHAHIVFLETSGAGDARSQSWTPKWTQTVPGELTTVILLGTRIVETGKFPRDSYLAVFTHCLMLHSESLLALQAPSTTKCDFCQVSFCGIGIPGRCIAAPILAQHLHSLSDLSDLIQCGAIYDVFDGNTVEVDILFDYLQAQNLTPRHIYREVSLFVQSFSQYTHLRIQIVAMILRSPRQFAPLIENELFVDVHAVSGGVDADPSAPRDSICRVCATEVLLWGLREWWVQERKKGFLEQSVTKRPDCPDGNACDRQKNHGRFLHDKYFNVAVL